ncbi:MAG: type II secretion system protein E [Porticoccaceae bacterium]|jgi:type II secretion system protein E
MDVATLLVQYGVLSRDLVEQLQAADAGASRIDRAAVECGMVAEEDVLRSLADAFGMQFVDLTDREICPELLHCFSSQDLFRHNLVPLEQNGRSVVVATADALNLEAIDELSSATGFNLEAVLACSEQIAGQLKKTLGVGGGTVREMVAQSGVMLDTVDGDADDIDDDSQSSSVVKLVNELLVEAVKQRASDIHLEPEENRIEIRYRVDGVLRLQPVPPEIHRFRAAIVSRLKIMAKLNIAEKRLPQDGRINLSVAGRDIDIRVSIIPMLHGEGVVMRLLDKSRTDFSLSGVEFGTSEIREQWDGLIRRPHGMVLVTGPTGSGKTTTLYSSLAEIRSPQTKIITVEDPVEYDLPGISQIHVQSRIGLSFAEGLRSILRHDPDVVLIGEIRDAETATSAVQASLTGHLVMSTLHTNDSSGAFTRLVDMGIEPYLVASTLDGVLAQRLVRRLCRSCREEYRPTASELPEDLDLPSGQHLYRPVGCRNCHGTNYSGRIAIFELLSTDSTIRQLCTRSAGTAEIRDYARSKGLVTLRQSGWERVIAGQTSVDEVLRVCANEV